jgi:hypothetical protein
LKLGPLGKCIISLYCLILEPPHPYEYGSIIMLDVEVSYVMIPPQLLRLYSTEGEEDSE